MATRPLYLDKGCDAPRYNGLITKPKANSGGNSCDLPRFRSGISDALRNSGEFSLDDVTCLVGKNESGKTAILKALHKLKPDNTAKDTLNPALDYPKRKWRPDTPVTEEAIDSSWELSTADVNAIEALFGPGTLESSQIDLSMGYDNIRRYDVEVNETKLLEASVDRARLSEQEFAPIEACQTVDEVIQTLKALSSRSSSQEALLGELTAKFPQGSDMAFINAVASRVPTFLYFDEYLTLPGTVSLNDISARKQQNALTDRDKIFIALLSLAGTTVENVTQAGTFEEFNSRLRAVSNQISDMVFKYWSQNTHLHVEVKLDQARPNDPAPFNSGYVFRTRIYNTRHRADTSFDERSRGFVWFFSFLIWFYDLKKRIGDDLIILLDEPGLSLHARAQADLLRYIDEELRPKYQVIYSTHSPFMVNPDRLLSCRTVEDVVVKDRITGGERLLGTKVAEDVLSTDVDTISPLQKALDYELTQTLFVGKNTLLVEGPSDLIYLKWFSRQLQLAGKMPLDYRWSICVGGGVTRIPGFVSLFRGNGLNIVAIADVQTGDKQKLELARKALGERLITLDKVTAQNEADIEDVLGRDFYIALVNKAFDLKSPHKLPSSRSASAPARVVKEVEAHMATLAAYPEFGHFVPADWLYNHEDDAPKLSGFSHALEAMATLIGMVNAHL